MATKFVQPQTSSNSLTLAIARFLENPIGWHGSSNPDDRWIILDRIKAAVSKKLTRFCAQYGADIALPDLRERLARASKCERVGKMHDPCGAYYPQLKPAE